MHRLLEMEWRDVAFLHWPVDPGVVAPTLPDGVDVDTHEGEAYLGVVPFRMQSIRPRGVPVGRSFWELKLRTYVTVDGDPGVYFYNLDADDRLGVTIARRLFKLPYYRARMSGRREKGLRLRSERVHDDAPPATFDATVRPTGPTHPVADTGLEAFLVERYRFYVASEGGQVYYADIDHPPWPLQDGESEIRRNDLFAAAGFDRPAGDPLVHFSPGIDVGAGALHRHRE